MAEILMAPAATREGGQRPSVVDTSGEKGTVVAEEMMVAEAASATAEAASMMSLLAGVAMAARAGSNRATLWADMKVFPSSRVQLTQNPFAASAALWGPDSATVLQ